MIARDVQLDDGLVGPNGIENVQDISLEPIVGQGKVLQAALLRIDGGHKILKSITIIRKASSGEVIKTEKELHHDRLPPQLTADFEVLLKDEPLY